MHKYLCFLLIISCPASIAKTHVVRLVTDFSQGKFYIDPYSMQISSGDTVKWINTENDYQNVVSDSVPDGVDNFASPMLKKQYEEWSCTFTHPGTYKYHCHPHAAAGMIGVIVVDYETKNESSNHDHDHDHDHYHDHGHDHHSFLF